LFGALEGSTYNFVAKKPEDEALLVCQRGTGLRNCPSARGFCTEAYKV